MREKEGYRDILEDLLKFNDGKRVITATKAAAYTGLDRRTVLKRYGVDSREGIAVPLLARRMAQ